MFKLRWCKVPTNNCVCFMRSSGSAVAIGAREGARESPLASALGLHRRYGSILRGCMIKESGLSLPSFLCQASQLEPSRRAWPMHYFLAFSYEPHVPAVGLPDEKVHLQVGEVVWPSLAKIYTSPRPARTCFRDKSGN